MKNTRHYLLMGLLGLSCQAMLAQQDHVNVDWKAQKNTENLIPFSANVISPEVHDDRTVTFRLKGPNVKTVTITGSMFVGSEARKQVPLVKGADGIWSVTIGPLEPNIYLYWMQLDGVTICDPNNTFTGQANMPAFSMVEVYGDKPNFYDAKPGVPHGEVNNLYYYSSVTKGTRYMLVYTPPGYNPKKRYPVLYLLGGSGDIPETWFQHGQINFIMDNLLAEKKAEPMIIVLPNNQVVHRNNPKHTDISFPLFNEEMKQCIIPFVESRYKVIQDRHGRAICGLSMGGRHSQYVGLNNLDLFANVGLLSAAIATDLTPALKEKDINDKLDYFFVGAGTHETTVNARHEVFHRELETLKVNHEYYVGGAGAHDLTTWRHLMYEKFLPTLWKKKK
jgi:enterochelin esterase family protein